MKLKKDFQPIHITIESHEELNMFQSVFYSYMNKHPSFFNKLTTISNYDQMVKHVFNFLDSYRT